jgi:16S rRNA (uracil1498-N3)-methyltransferase
MKRVLCPELPSTGHAAPLPESEAEHLTRVLRLGDGDFVEALDGRGHSVRAVLRLRGGAGPRLEFVADTSAESSHGVPPIRLETAVLKGEAMEWLVEKSVELGVETLVPLLTAHTVVQIKGKGPEAFRDRWQKIADQALKQCGRLERMNVALPISLEEHLAQTPSTPESPRLWCDEAERGSAPTLLNWLSAHRKLNGVRLLVGPEGGWSDLERSQMSFERVSLSPWVLRAETAGLFAVSLASAYLTKAGE